MLSLLAESPAASIGPAVALAVPVLGAIGILLAGRRPDLREGVTLTTAAVLLVVVARLWSGFEPARPDAPWRFVVGPGIELALRVHALGLMYALIGSGLWILNSLYSIGYMRAKNERHQTRFYTCFALALACVMGLAFAANGFTLFVFYEGLTLSTVLLVAHHGTPAALRSARTYLGILVTTSVALLMVGLLGVNATAGSLDFGGEGVFGAALAEGRVSPWTVGGLYLLCVFGIGKAAIMPFHRWLPAAMVAPTPVSALLHAVAVVKAGVFCVLQLTVGLFGVATLRRVAEETFAVDVILVAACFTILAGSLVAMRQHEIKRLLAYSTISQLSYIVVGAALLNPTAIAGGALHMLMHAVGKITLFFCAGAIYVATGKTSLRTMDGLGRRMPWTFGAFALASLSIIGLPPLGGAWSKWWLIVGSLEAHRWPVAAVLACSTLLNIAYLIPIATRAFLRPLPEGEGGGGVREAPILCVIPPVVTAILSLVLFLFPDGFFELVRDLGAG